MSLLTITRGKNLLMSEENLNDILENKSLDMIYVGPYDLSISHGFSPDKVFAEKKMLNIYKQVLKIVKK